MDLRLSGKRALVTGASAGLGRAVVELLAEEGCDVAFAARRGALLADLAAEVETRWGRRSVPIEADLSRVAEVDRVVAAAVDSLGGLDVVVNNVGASGFGDIDSIADGQWEADLGLKLMACVRTTKAAIPHLRRSGGGRIVNITGTGGRQPIATHLTGGAANAAISNFSGAVARTVGPDGIHVIAFSPGPMRTERLEEAIRKLAEQQSVSVEEAERRAFVDYVLPEIPELREQAATIAFLVSERAACITGVTVTADGGMTRGL